MTRRHFLAVGTLAFLIALGGSAPGRAQIVNGSFENGTFTPDGNDLMSLPPGSTAMTGWTTITAELVWGDNGNPFVSPGSDGTKFLDLTGYHDAAPYGGISQTIATVLGTTYHMAFDLGVDQSDLRYSGPISVQATAGSASVTPTYNPPGPGVQWGTFTLDFTATSTSTTISFQGVSGGQYIGLDNVRLSAVPEPSTSLLGGMAAIGLTRLIRRRKR